MRLTERRLRSIVRKHLMSEAWNDDITNMFAKLLDFLHDAYNERQEATYSSVESDYSKAQIEDEAINAYAKLWGISDEEATKVGSDGMVNPSSKPELWWHAVMHAGNERFGAYLEEIMERLNDAEGQLENMKSDDDKQAKEAADAAMEALGSAMGVASGIAKYFTENSGKLGAHWGKIASGAEKLKGQEDLSLWAEGLAAVGPACEKTTSLFEEALGLFDPSTLEHEKAKVVQQKYDAAKSGVQIFGKAGSAIASKASSVASELAKLESASEKNEALIRSYLKEIL